MKGWKTRFSMPGLSAPQRRVEHYEIAAYGTVRTMAETLAHKKAVKLLDRTLREEKAAEEKLISSPPEREKRHAWLSQRNFRIGSGKHRCLVVAGTFLD